MNTLAHDVSYLKCECLFTDNKVRTCFEPLSNSSINSFYFEHDIERHDNFTYVELLKSS